MSEWESKGFKLIDGKLIKNAEIRGVGKQKNVVEEKKRAKSNNNSLPMPTVLDVLAKTSAPKQSKYRNVKVSDGDRTYDSKKEAKFASQLDLLIDSGDVISYDWQPEFPIFVLTNKNGEVKKIPICSYKLDFMVCYSDGSVKYYDVKGYDKRTNKYRTTPEFNLKKKLVEAIYGINIELVSP